MNIDFNNLEDSISVIRQGTLFENHGAFADCYTCDGFRAMTIQQFKDEVVPRLHDTEMGGPFFHYVIRDLANGAFFTVEPDCVFEFHVKDLKQISTNDVIKELKSSDTNNSWNIDLNLNCPFPIVSLKQNSVAWNIVLKVQQLRFMFNSSIHPVLNRIIYLPPVLYKLTANRADNSPQVSGICVLLSDAANIEDMKLADLALPNVYNASSRFSICVGSSRSTERVNLKSLGYAQVACKALELFVSSMFNRDLFSNDRLPSNLLAVFTELYEGADNKKKQNIKATLKSFVEDVDDVLKSIKEGKLNTALSTLTDIYMALFIICLSFPEGHTKLAWKRAESRAFFDA